MKEKFTFSDILIVPDYAEEDVREYADVSSCRLFDVNMNIPIISAPMDSITGIEMMDAMNEEGAIGVHHRYCDKDVLMEAASMRLGGIAISPSMPIDFVVELNQHTFGLFFVVDVAHGDSKRVLDFCEELIKNDIKNIVSGNIVTPQAAERYLKIGINHFRVGVGAGSRCVTRLVTGFGYPQGSAIVDIKEQFVKEEIVLISDGGCNSLGDIIKAYALGADFVMSGSLFAGTDECPLKTADGKVVYRGMASQEALEQRKKEFFIEGDSVLLEPRGSVSKVLGKIEDTIKHACHYGGVTHYKQLEELNKIFITGNAYAEGFSRK